MSATDFSISRFTRRCVVSGRAIRPGEAYYSVISESGDELLRSDVAAEAWTGPPEATVAWWRGKRAAAGGSEAAPNEVLLKLLREWSDDEPRQSLRHLLALLLLRRKVLRVAPAVAWLANTGDQAPDDSYEDVRYIASDGGEPITVKATMPAPERLADLQQQLESLVYGEAPCGEAA